MSEHRLAMGQTGRTLAWNWQPSGTPGYCISCDLRTGRLLAKTKGSDRICVVGSSATQNLPVLDAGRIAGPILSFLRRKMLGNCLIGSLCKASLLSSIEDDQDETGKEPAKPRA